MTETTTRVVNINIAAAPELAHLTMLGKERAEALVSYRNEHGSFKSWEDLHAVPGFSDIIIDDLKNSGATLGGIAEEGEQIHD
ncbi:MAG: helix-hairpin-helix domain-containing protein [Nitrospirota bacterium]